MSNVKIYTNAEKPLFYIGLIICVLNICGFILLFLGFEFWLEEQYFFDKDIISRDAEVTSIALSEKQKIIIKQTYENSGNGKNVLIYAEYEQDGDIKHSNALLFMKGVEKFRWFRKYSKIIVSVCNAYIVTYTSKYYLENPDKYISLNLKYKECK